MHLATTVTAGRSGGKECEGGDVGVRARGRLAPVALAIGLLVVTLIALAGPPAASARTDLTDCGYGKRGLPLTSVAAHRLPCTTAWDVVAGSMKTVMARWDGGWFQELYQSRRGRSFNYDGWRCTVRATSHEGYSLKCKSGVAKIVSGTGA